MEPIFLAETDSVQNCFSSLKNLVENLPHSPCYYAIEASGFIGLNYLLLFSPEELVFFHHHQLALNYMKLIIELIFACETASEFISRIFSRPLQAFIEKGGSVLPSFSKLKLQGEMFKDSNQALERSLNEFTQWNYLATPYDDSFLQETVSLLSEEGKRIFCEVLLPFQKGEVLFEATFCKRLLPCWPVNQHVPFSMNQKMDKNAFGEYEPNTNTFYYGMLWLASKETFCLIKQKLAQARLSFMRTDFFEHLPLRTPAAVYLKEDHQKNKEYWLQYIQRLKEHVSISNFFCLLTAGHEPEFFTH